MYEIIQNHNVASDNSGDSQPILPMDYSNQNVEGGRFAMQPGGEELDGMMVDALRGQGEEYDAEDYYDEEELDLQDQAYGQQPDRPYADEEPFDRADA